MIDKNKKEGIIHVGFQKCASTFLQKHIFPKLENYKFIHWSNDSIYHYLGSLFLDDIPQSSAIFNLPHENFLVSREGFMRPSIIFPFQEYGKTRSKDIFIANICRLFKDSGRLIFIIRRQDSMIESWMRYKPTLFVDGKTFFWEYPIKGTSHLNAKLDNNKGCFYLSDFDFFTIIQRITTVIDKDRVHILIYEDLENNKTKFYAQLGEAVNEDLSRFYAADFPKENVSGHLKTLPKVFMKYQNLSIVNRFPNYIKIALKKLLLKNIGKLYEEDRKKIMKFYRNNNCRLSNTFDLELEKYNYY